VGPGSAGRVGEQDRLVVVRAVNRVDELRRG
jgi:hypothetical protein